MSKNEFHKISRSPEPKATSEFKELENYKIERTIDEGTFGKVKLGIHIPTKEKVAIKILEKSKITDQEDSERIYREINFLKKLVHKNIIKIYEIIENPKNYYLIMEFAPGGELFNYIVKKKRLDDMDASYFFAQIINGIEYIHKNKICHRDLKPENLLLTKDRILKIIDFGLSNSYLENQLLQTPCGSPCYASPEMILGKKYSGLFIDIWSIGIILYAMVCGFLPFEDKNNDKLYKKILEGKLEFPDYISELSKDLIVKILNVNPKKRIKLEEIKEHQFYKIGEKQLKQEESGYYDDEKLHFCVVETMAEIGFNKDDIVKNLNAKKHNNITTTYVLFFQKYKLNPALCTEKLKALSTNSKSEIKTTTITEVNGNKNININIHNVNQVGNININILETNIKVNGKKEINPFKNSSANDLSILHNHGDAIADKISKKQEDDSLKESNNTTKNDDPLNKVVTPKRERKDKNKTDSVSLESNINIDMNIDKLETLSPKKGIMETNIQIKKKPSNQINSTKFNTSITYEEHLNRSINGNEFKKPSSPPERIKDKDVINLKKNQANKTFRKSNVLKNKENEEDSAKKEVPVTTENRHSKKYSEMDIIIEESDLNNAQNKAIKTETKESKIEKVVIDFKKKTTNITAKHASINDPIELNIQNKQNTLLLKSPVNSKNESKYKDPKPNVNLRNVQASPQSKNIKEAKPSVNLKNILASPQSKNTNLKDQKPTVNTKNIQSSPVNKNSNVKDQKSLNLKSVNRSPEKKVPQKIVEKKPINPTIIIHNDRNNIARSNSPVSKTNTTSTKGDENTEKNQILIDKIDTKKDRKSSNDQIRGNAKNANNQSNTKATVKKENDVKKTTTPMIKKESINNIANSKTIEEKKKISNFSNTKQTNDMKKDSKKIEKKNEENKSELKDQIRNDKNNDMLRKEEMIKQPSQTNKITKSKSIGNDFDLLLKSQKIFATCNISDYDDIVEKFTQHFGENKIEFNYIGNLKFECKRDNFIVGLDFIEVDDNYQMKILLKEGLESDAKDFMKSILNLVL